MKVCITSGIFPPRIGGPSNQTYQLASLLAKQGLEVVVITFGDRNDRVIINGFKTYYINGYWGSSANRLNRFKRAANLIWQLPTIFRRERPDVIHHQTAMDYFAVLVVICARLLHIPCVAKYCIDLVWTRITASSRRRFTHEEVFTSSTVARLLAKIQRVTLSSFTLVWTTTPEQTKVLTSLHHLPEEQIINFPNFVELRPFRSKQESHNSEGPLEILTVSRFHRGKRLENAILAFSKLKCDRVRLRLVGGEDEEVEIELKALVKKMALEDSVIFTGPVSPLDITSYFHQADIFFLPSSYETFGIVFLEAMAAGLPIVSTCMGSIPEVVPDGKAGFLVECDDVEGMAERLDRLLADRALRNSMGQFGRKWSMGYELEDNIGVFIDLYGHLKSSNISANGV